MSTRNAANQNAASWELNCSMVGIKMQDAANQIASKVLVRYQMTSRSSDW